MKLFGIIVASTGLALAAGGASRAQDAAKGEKIFNQCKACHSLNEILVGPPLKGVVGRKAGSFADYEYSDVMKAAGDGGLTWTKDELVKYLANPTEYLTAYAKSKGKEASGQSKMIFMLANEQQRKDVVAYLADQN